MSVLVCGSRDYRDKIRLYNELNRVFSDDKYSDMLTGGATGADRLAEDFAREHGIPCLSIPADWTKYGKIAGPIRNSEMIARKPLLVVAFSSQATLTAGTADTVRKARACGIPVEEYLTK